MPTVKRIGPYRLFFYSSDRDEPRHIHIEREDKVAKFWLEPVRLQKSGGFNRQELGQIQKMLEKNKAELLEVWNDYFAD